MARLNEPPIAPAAITAAGPGAVESVDACKFPAHDTRASHNTMPRTKPAPAKQAPAADLQEVKRRFIRQNRELAKNNSTQSLRIRSLELENSRLLAENFDLRSHNFQLQHEEKKSLTAAMEQAKSEMQETIAGLIQATFSKVLQEEVVDKQAILDPSKRQYRNRQPLAELMRDSQMSPIAEDKVHSRETIDYRDFRPMRLSNDSSNGSPDIGPPPVAHFDDAEPVKMAEPLDTCEQPVTMSKAPEDDLLPESISVETRRKRKDGHPRPEVRRHSILAQSPVKCDSEATTTILRKGAKRKLADRETDMSMKPPNRSDFTFTRKMIAKSPTTQGNTATVKAAAPVREKTTNITTAPTQSPPRPIRRVLGEKSANLSPRKADLAEDKPSKDLKQLPVATKSAAPKERGPSRARRVSLLPLPPIDAPSTISVPLEAVADVQAPETPAEPDFFSPISSEPSTKPNGKCDTPPPADLSTLSNTTDGGQRPSRRARSAVNYAEPSLIAKMRRPDKQMVDALSGLQDPRRAMSTLNERRDAPTMSTVTIKQEPQDDDFSNPRFSATGEVQPGSPLSGKSGHTRQAATEDGDTLTTANRRHRQSELLAPGDSCTRVGASPLDRMAKRMEELELYEFKDSSSPTTEDAAQPAVHDTSKARTHRRHSSMPREGQSSNAIKVKREVAVDRGDRVPPGRRRSTLI